MIILLSPSKTQSPKKIDHPLKASAYPEKTLPLSDMISSMNIEDLGQLMKVKDKLLQETYNLWQNHRSSEPTHAISSYTGLVFKYLDISTYDQKALNYLQKHLRIFSALYGLLKPFDAIAPYRLDMTMKPEGINLYDYWSDTIEAALSGDDEILDLSSKEFGRLYKGPKVTIEFRDYDPSTGKYKNLATYSKMARGRLLDLIVTANIEKVAAIKDLTFDGYHYNQKLSNQETYLFTRYDQADQ